MKAKRIHPQSLEGPFGLASLTWEILLALTLNRCDLCILWELLLSLASGIIKGHIFIWSLHSVLCGSAAKEVCVDCLRSGQASLPLAPQNSCLLPFHVVVCSSNPGYSDKQVILMARVLGECGGAQVLICRTGILATVESPSKRVSLKPRIILSFFPSKKSNLHFGWQFSVFSVL